MKSVSYTRFLFFFLFIAVSNLLVPQNKEALADYLSDISKGDLLKHGIISVYAENSTNGEEIFSFNSEKSLAPASNLKVVTSGAALSILGEDFRFKTRIYHNGIITPNGVLNGNIYIKGAGDPTLGSNQVKGSLSLEELLSLIEEQIRKMNIRKINGDIIADDLLYERHPIPDYWYWIDIGNYYGASNSALCIHENLYYLDFKPGLTEGDPTEIHGTRPKLENFSFSNYVKTGAKGSGDNGYIYSAPFSNFAFLRGTVPAGVDTFTIKGAIPNPPLTFAQLLKNKLLERGVIISGDAKVTDVSPEYDESKMITEIESPELKDIVYLVNKKSNNLYTEHLLLALGNHYAQKRNTGDAVKSLMEFLKENEVNIEGVSLEDGCGLSGANMITTKSIASLLSFMTKKPVFDAYYNSFPIAGDPNDLGGFKKLGIGTPIEKNARIKSGTINGVRAFSGYLHSAKGELISFSMIVNNYFGSMRSVDDVFKEILILLYQ